MFTRSAICQVQNLELLPAKLAYRRNEKLGQPCCPGSLSTHLSKGGAHSKIVSEKPGHVNTSIVRDTHDHGFPWFPEDSSGYNGPAGMGR
jgi:hypothetical protein